MRLLRKGGTGRTDAACCQARSIWVNVDRIDGHFAFVACECERATRESDAHPGERATMA